jgi:hypothetical protein
MFGQLGVLVVVESEEQPQSKKAQAQSTGIEIRVIVDAPVILASQRRTNHIEMVRQLNSQMLFDTRAGALDAFTPGKGRQADETFSVRAVTRAGQRHHVRLGQELVEEIQ